MAKKVFILTEIMRSANSGFFIEGTDIAMDYPEKYPLPFETEVLEDERPVALRLLPHCPYLEKEKQVKNGFPERFSWTDADRKRLTFQFGRLELDDKRDKIFIEYVQRGPWMEGNEERKTRPETKTIFRLFDEDALVQQEITDEEDIVKAKGLIFQLDDSAIRNLYRLSNPGAKSDGLTKISTMKKHLLQVADVNPYFIMEGVKTNRDKIIVLVSRAIEEKIVSLEFPGTVAVFNEAENEWQSLITVNDSLGQEDKFDRTVDYLLTDQGATDLAVIEAKLEGATELVEEE